MPLIGLVALPYGTQQTQQGAQQPAGAKNPRETNVELREENLKTSPENLIILLLRGFLSALSFPKLPGDVKD